MHFSRHATLLNSTRTIPTTGGEERRRDGPGVEPTKLETTRRALPASRTLAAVHVAGLAELAAIPAPAPAAAPARLAVVLAVVLAIVLAAVLVSLVVVFAVALARLTGA